MFSHLHIHTEYSLLDGLCRIPQLVARAKELGMTSLAITDHGTLYGIIDFYLAARDAGIKPIIGCEVYVAPGSRHGRTPADKNPYHLILLARNRTGYDNLLRLVTKAHLEGFFYKPRVDRELLSQHHEGLIALSACMQGEPARLLLEGRAGEARERAVWYKEVFGDFYLEIQRHPIPELERINQGLMALSKELDIPLVATNDVHYIDRADAPSQELLLCIQTNTSVYDEKRLKMAGDFFYLRSPEEMAELFADLPQALEITQEIADKCHLELDFGRLYLPQVELPPGKTPDDYLAEICWQALPQHYPSEAARARERLAYELEVIRQTHFAPYFLVVWDMAAFARGRNILMGVRGSAAASIVLYCLGITEVDPLEHRLVFERFLNVERREMPDIDLDFQDDRREEVLAYVRQKYGPDRVAQIITFGTLGARAAIRDVGRALGMSYGDVDRVARLIPFRPGMTLEQALKENPEFQAIYLQDEAVRHLIDSAQKLEGVSRHASTHAAGVVISQEPLVKHMPLQRAGRGGEETTMTQFSMENIARLGLLKMDFLGLVNLTILARAGEIIQQHRGVSLNLHAIPMDDARTYQLLASGETNSVFQLEGEGMRRYIKELKPSTFSDIAAMVALYRPGPMEHIPTFIRAKHGLEPIRYPHPALEDILRETYGVIVYQDQVLLIVQAFAGYTLGQADIFRKAMGKKIPEVMKKERQNFLDGARKKGFSSEVAEAVFALIEPFAGYAFNKAHSVSYALIAYQTAYLKANYPVEYMTALLNCYLGLPEKVASAIAECHRLGIKVFPPDINRSQALFTVEDRDGASGIRFGLACIKNVGQGAVEPIIRSREQGGAFRSVEDLCRRADLRGMNRRVWESLIKAGALDSMGDRGGLLQSVDRLLSLAQQEQRLRETGQATLFDLWGQSVPLPLASLEVDRVQIPTQERLAWEKELLGVYLSDNPLGKAVAQLRSQVSHLCGEIGQDMKGQIVVVAGMVASSRESFTREKRAFASVLLEDLSGSLEITVWPEVYERSRELWQEGNILLVTGTVKPREDRLQLVCKEARIYRVEEAPAQETGRKRLVITLAETQDETQDLARLRQVFSLLRAFPGKTEVALKVSGPEGVTPLDAGLATGYSPDLHQRLAELVGEAGIKLEQV